MTEHRSKMTARPDLLPWQAALMVLCVTVAGVLHEHPAMVRPVVASLQTAQLPSGVAHASHPGDVLNVALWLTRY